MNEIIDNMQSASRAQTVILSGPAVTYNERSSNLDILNLTCQTLRNVYNFDLKHGDVKECTRFAPSNNNELRVKLTFLSNFVKDALMDRVIQKNKSNGVDLNVNEFLSSKNSSLLFNIRQIKKKNPGRIFAVFSRNGKVFYKLNQDDRASLIKSKDDISKLVTDKHLINE